MGVQFPYIYHTRSVPITIHSYSCSWIALLFSLASSSLQVAMAAAMQLNTLVSNMFATGLLDDQFKQLQLLKDRSAPDFVAEIVTLFCEDGERIIRELAKQLDKPCVDFNEVDAFVHQLKGSSACVGAQIVKNTCIQFHEVCQKKSIDGCLKTLDALRNNFYDLRSKFQTMLQLEQKVQAFYPEQ